PTRKTFAANHSAPNTDATPMPIDSHTCQAGGGDTDVIRSSMPMLLIGGRKLMTTLKSESGLREIGIHMTHGTVRSSVIGIVSVCASRMSLTADPAAIISEPITRYMIRKKTTR